MPSPIIDENESPVIRRRSFQLEIPKVSMSPVIGEEAEVCNVCYKVYSYLATIKSEQDPSPMFEGNIEDRNLEEIREQVPSLKSSMVF